jgi:hypothetical protein
MRLKRLHSVKNRKYSVNRYCLLTEYGGKIFLKRIEPDIFCRDEGFAAG